MGPNGLKSISIRFKVAIVRVSGPTQKICILALNAGAGLPESDAYCCLLEGSVSSSVK